MSSTRAHLEKALNMFAFGEREIARSELRRVLPADIRPDEPLMEAAWWLPGWGALMAVEAPLIFAKSRPMGLAWLTNPEFLPHAAARADLLSALDEGLYSLAVDSGWPTDRGIEITRDYFPSNIQDVVEDILREFDREPVDSDYAAAIAFLAAYGKEPSAELLAERAEM